MWLIWRRQGQSSCAWRKGRILHGNAAHSRGIRGAWAALYTPFR